MATPSTESPPTALKQGKPRTSPIYQKSPKSLDCFCASCRERVNALASAFRQKQSEGVEAASTSRAESSASSPQAGQALDKPQCSWQRQAQLLLKRSWRQISRDRATIVARTVANVSAALIFGSIFNRMKLSETAIQDRLGLLQVMLAFKMHVTVSIECSHETSTVGFPSIHWVSLPVM